MDSIKKFEIFSINEAMGVAEATMFYSDLLKMRCTSEILNFIDETYDKDVVKKIQEVKEITFTYRDLRRFITDWNLYSYFPVSEIKLNLTMSKEPVKALTNRDEETYPYGVGGYMSRFVSGKETTGMKIMEPIKISAQEHSLSIDMGISFNYSPKFNKNQHEKQLDVKIESVILHELNHAYEYYQRRLNGADHGLGLSYTWASIGDNIRRRPTKIWRYWQGYFTYYIYMSEPAEVRANIQEAKSFVDRLSLDKFKKTRTWLDAKAMQEFDYKKFLEKFDSIVAKHNPTYVGKITSSLIQEFKEEYKKNVKYFKETPTGKNSPSTFGKMDDEQFFMFFEKKIRDAGNKLIKGMLRLYSLKEEDADDII